MYILTVLSYYDSEISEIIGVFDTQEKAEEKRIELLNKFDDEFRISIEKFELNKVEGIKFYLKEEN